MAATRQAIMHISRPIFEAILPVGKTINCVADKLGLRYEWLVEALYLPPGTKITGVSAAARFEYDEICVRVESPDFVETLEGNHLPEVQAVYGWDQNGNNAVFACWTGPAMNRPSSPPEMAGPRFVEWRQKATMQPDASPESIHIHFTEHSTAFETRKLLVEAGSTGSPFQRLKPDSDTQPDAAPQPVRFREFL